MPQKREKIQRRQACEAYLNDQTEENWIRLHETIADELGGFILTLKDQNEPEKSVKVKVDCTTDFLHLYPEGYGEPGAMKGEGSPVFLEFWERKLRVVISPDILDMTDNKQIIDLENAREDRVTDWS